jgi:Protein of unknown function (DUF3616)
MRQSCSALFLSFVLAAGTVVQAQRPCPSNFTDIPSVKRDGKKIAREVSGATYCQGRIWVVDNEDDQNLLVMEENGSLSAHPLPADGRISDLEGITSDGESLYLIAGGGLSKEGRVKSKRFAMARVTLHQGEPTEVRIVDMLKWLVPFAQELGMEMEKAEGPDGEKIKVPENGKFEGLAMMPDGRLLMGIRKPLIENLAMILQLDGYKEAFDQEKASLIQPKLVAELDLDGGGISSLEYDPEGKRLLVLGIHAKKDRTDLYAWKEDAGKKGKPKRICKIKGHKAEGVVRDEDSHRILILCDDEDPDKTKMGRYTFLEE